MKVTLLTAESISKISSGHLNALGIFTHIDADNFPVRPPISLGCLAYMEIEDEYDKKYPYTIQLISEDGSPVFAIEGELTYYKSKFATLPALTFFHRLTPTFRQPGHYEFKFLLEGEVLTSIPLIMGLDSK